MPFWGRNWILGGSGAGRIRAYSCLACPCMPRPAFRSFPLTSRSSPTSVDIDLRLALGSPRSLIPLAFLITHPAAPSFSTMSNRRVKSMAVDDDDFDNDDYYDDDPEEEEELSEQDQQQMRQGTVKVREALGNGFKVSDKAIQDALWNYYYDVGKSVTYLKSKFPPFSLHKCLTHSQTNRKAPLNLQNKLYCKQVRSDSRLLITSNLSYSRPTRTNSCAYFVLMSFKTCHTHRFLIRLR